MRREPVWIKALVVVSFLLPSLSLVLSFVFDAGIVWAYVLCGLSALLSFTAYSIRVTRRGKA